MSDQTFGEGLPVIHVTFEEADVPQFAKGDRIYATEPLYYDNFEGLGYDLQIHSKEEGTVVKLTGDDAHDLLVEWDAGFLGTVNSGSVALTGSGATCTNPLHDHATTILSDGTEVAEPVPMVCNDCAEPTHYDTAAEWYFHDDPNAPPCFLAESNVANPCTPKE